MKFLKAVLISVLIFAATLAGAALKMAEIIHFPVPIPDSKPVSEDTPPSIPVSRLQFDQLQGTVNVLLVGLDELDAGNRSDAIAIAFFNLDARTVGVLSIPRDSRVLIPGRGWDKINHAYNYGGLDLLKRTLANLTNVTINYSVVLNYDSFPRIIDLMGGVDIYVDKPMRYNDYSQKLFINIPQGMQHFDGIKALQYVRFRHDPLGDIGRVQRQQKFISIVMEKLKTVSIIPKIPSLVDEAMSAVNTDLSPIEALRLAYFANSLETGRINFIMTPGKATYIGGLSYWIIDPVKLSVLTAKLVAGDEDLDRDVMAENPPVDLGEDMAMLVSQVGKIGILNGDGAAGLAKRASQIFQNIGIDVSFTGDAKHHGYVSSSIIYPRAQEKQAAEALAQLCGITNMSLLRHDSSVQWVSIILGHDKETIFKRLEDFKIQQ